MNANELMIGDWVALRYKSDDLEVDLCKTFRVTQLRNEHGYLCAWSKFSGNMGDVERLEPIPITPEILEKNGWSSRMNGTGEFYLERPLLDAAILTKTVIGFQMNHGPFLGLPIHYVHELQHALRLCGIEKEIVL